MLLPVHVRFTPLQAPPESRKAPNLDSVPATLFSHCTRIRVSVRVGVRVGAGAGLGIRFWVGSSREQRLNDREPIHASCRVEDEIAIWLEDKDACWQARRRRFLHDVALVRVRGRVRLGVGVGVGVGLGLGLRLGLELGLGQPGGQAARRCCPHESTACVPRCSPPRRRDTIDGTSTSRRWCWWCAGGSHTGRTAG